MAFEFSQRSRDRMKGVHPDLVAVMELALSRSPIDFTILEGVRNADRQKKLVERGASQTENSRHLTGHAIDVAPWFDQDKDGDIDGDDLWHWPLYYQLEPVIKKAAEDLGVEIEWGGDWRTLKDGPHWQLPWHAYDADDMTPRAGKVALDAPRITSPLVAPRKPAETPEAPLTGLSAVLGKYAPQGSNTSRVGYLLAGAGALVYLAQGPVPGLLPAVQLLIDANVIKPDDNGVEAFAAGLLAILGRAAVRT